MYRKFFEPEYGDIAPWVRIEPMGKRSSRGGKSWRTRYNFETLTDLTMMIRNCRCFDDIMEIETEDFRIDRDNESFPLRVYHPESPGLHPILLFFHGGGWCMNNIDIYDYVPRYLAKYGDIVVVAPDYRLAPEYKFPVGLEDCYRAFTWAIEHAAQIGGSVDSVSVCGDSAGGNFAAAITHMARDRNAPRIHKQILIYPCVTMNLDQAMDSALRYAGKTPYEMIDPHNTNSGEGYLPNPDIDRKNPYVSPLEAKNFHGIPAACFISAECDPYFDHGLMYAARLEDEGIPVEYHVYKGMIHGFINRPYQRTFEALDDIIHSIPKVCKGDNCHESITA